MHPSTVCGISTAYYLVYFSVFFIFISVRFTTCHSLNSQLQHFSASAQTAKLEESDKTSKQLKQDEGFIFGMLTFLFMCSTFFDWLSENRTLIWQQLAR